MTDKKGSTDEMIDEKNDMAADQDDLQGDGGETGLMVAEDEASKEEAELAKLKEAVGVSVEDAGTLRKKLTVTVPRDYLTTRMQDQYTELKREAQVAGFRRGRAPMRLIEKRFGRDVGDQLLAPVFSGALLSALEKVELKERVIGEPRVWVKAPESRTGEGGGTKTAVVDKLMEMDKAVEFLHLPPEGDLEFSAEVELRPEFDLPDIDKITVGQHDVEVTDAMVDEEVDRIRSMHGVLEPVEGGTVEAHDELVADVAVRAGDRVLDEKKNTNVNVRDQWIESVFAKGLSDALIGKKSGDMATVETTFPDDHEEADLRGKTATIEVTIHDIKRIKLPPFDADLLTKLDVESEDELRRLVREELDFRRQEMVREKKRDDVRAYLLKNTKIELPADLSQRQTERSIARKMVQLYRMGIPQQQIEQHLDKLRESATEEAINDLKVFFIMDGISEKLEVKVTEEELNSAIANIARRNGQRFDRVRDDLARDGGLENLYIQIRDEKIMDKLIADAQEVDGDAAAK